MSITQKDIANLLNEITGRPNPTLENPIVFVMDGYTIKNDGTGLFILCEDDKWESCEIDSVSKKIKIL